MKQLELFNYLRLINTPGIGNIISKKLIQSIGSVEGVFKATKKEITSIHNMGEYLYNNLHKHTDDKYIENEIKFINKNNIKVLSFFDQDYPSLLKNCADAPLLLFTNGNINLSENKIISIIGTRNLTKYGSDFCHTFFEAIAIYKPIIVSGLAYGTDILAHKLAIKYGLQTIAVMPCGLNQIYPKDHDKYIKDINLNGGLLTEFWSSKLIDRENFIKRNRIVAGISEATVLIESAQKGGSLITTGYANEYNRDVFALPGRTTDKFSAGCNALIKNHQANILTSVDDLIKGLNWDVNIDKTKTKFTQAKLIFDLTDLDQKILDILKNNGKKTSDDIAFLAQKSINEINSSLINLELNELVKSLPGKYFEIS